MKNVEINAIAVFSMLVFLTSCEPPGRVEKVGEQQEVKYSYPVSRLITDASGRQLQVLIVGRSTDQITFERQSDGKRYNLPTNQLSDIDQAFVSQLPIKEAPAIVVKKKTKKKGEPEDVTANTPLYIKNRLKIIAELESDVVLKKAEVKSKTLDPIALKHRKREIKDIEKEVKQIKLDIATYKHNNRL